MVSANMCADEIQVRVRAADTSSTLTARRVIFGKRRSGEITIEGGRLRFDLPPGVEQRAYFSGSDLSNGDSPGPLIPLHRHGIVGVRAEEWQSQGLGDAKLLVQLFIGNSVERSREVDVGAGHPSWFALPPETDGLGLVVMLEGSGEVDIGPLEILIPPPRGWMPIGTVLINSLELARFPHGATSWIDDLETEVVGPGRVRIDEAELSLVPPIDWKIGPPRDRTFQLALHGFSFADAILATEETEGAVWLADVFEDWKDKHPSHPHSTTEMDWNDMSVASRTVTLLRLVDFLRSNSPARAASLAVAAAEHAQWLAHDRNYMPGHDHGLFSDTALEYAARALESHTLAERWRRRAGERMASTLESVVCAAEGSILEHSPAYVEKIAALFAHRRRNGLRDSLPLDLLDRFEETLSIVTAPNGRLLPWGDTGHDHVSRRGRRLGAFGLTRTGWGISQLEKQTVALCAGYHSSAHKHGDELSVVFYDSDGPIVTEAGFPGYGYRHDEFRAYGTSERAHNAVVINDETADWRTGDPYGAALWHASGIQNWHLLGGWNPLQSAGSHMRFVLHGPGVVLITDLLTGPDIRAVERILHFDDRLVYRGSSDSSVDFEDWSMANWTETRSTEMSLVSDGAETKHFPSSGVTANHHVVLLRDSGPGIRIMTIARPEARIGIGHAIASGSNEQIRIELGTTVGGRISWILTDPWSGDGGWLELQAVEV